MLFLISFAAVFSTENTNNWIIVYFFVILVLLLITVERIFILLFYEFSIFLRLLLLSLFQLKTQRSQSKSIVFCHSFVQSFLWSMESLCSWLWHFNTCVIWKCKFWVTFYVLLILIWLGTFLENARTNPFLLFFFWPVP